MLSKRLFYINASKLCDFYVASCWENSHKTRDSSTGFFEKFNEFFFQRNQVHRGLMLLSAIRSVPCLKLIKKSQVKFLFQASEESWCTDDSTRFLGCNKISKLNLDGLQDEYLFNFLWNGFSVANNIRSYFNNNSHDMIEENISLLNFTTQAYELEAIPEEDGSIFRDDYLEN